MPMFCVVDHSRIKIDRHLLTEKYIAVAKKNIAAATEKLRKDRPPSHDTKGLVEVPPTKTD